VPDFWVSSKKSPRAVERDAFRFEELYKFLSAAAFGGCAGRARIWTPGEFYYQGFLFWGDLIAVFTGMRPGEVSQLRCRDLLDLYGRPHFRFALLSIEDEADAQHEAMPGGNDGKTDAAFRWVSLHWLLIRLGIVERRDAIVADYIARRVKDAGGRSKLSDEELAVIEWEAGEQWLFPDWPVYVKKTGEIKWSHALSKAFTYGIAKLGMKRVGLSQYSARHYFKGLIDAVRGLSERSRKVIMGHSTKGEVTMNYGPKVLTEQESEVVQSLSSFEIWRLAKVLIRAKRKAERGELKVIDAWRNDTRSGDEKFQEALAKRAQLYR
jgi:integrase